MTKSQRIRESAVMISSTMPSAKYSCSGSPLILTKGNTAIDGLSGSGSGGLPHPPHAFGARHPLPQCAGLSGENFAATKGEHHAPNFVLAGLVPAIQGAQHAR